MTNEPASAALLPCPWCSATNGDLSSNGMENHMVVCTCGAEGPPAESDLAAIAAWNRRAAAPALPPVSAATRVVPVEPTEEMLAAIDEACSNVTMSEAHSNYGVWLRVWSAMLAAAPALPSPAEAVGTVTITHFRGDPGMENRDFDYFGNLPPGSHRLYAAPVAALPSPEPGDVPEQFIATLRDAARYLLQNGQTKQGMAVQACVTMLEDDSE